MKHLQINKWLLFFSILFLQASFVKSAFSNQNTFANPASTLTINFTAMEPHLGELLEIRVVDKYDGKEAGRTKIGALTSADFQVTVDGIQVGHSYWIDFFADHNNNGSYDAPPVDHAWRLELNNATGSDIVNFAHNTNFTDIKWKYMLTVNFTGMTPHVGQLLELRVIDDANGTEVGRTRVEKIPSPNFNVSLPVLLSDQSNYTMDFYADENSNGLFDNPPTDHTWEVKFNNNFHDTTINFAHNTNFTNINWNYLLTFNLMSMTPHLGEMIALRLVKDSDNSELSRVIIPALPLANVSVGLPGLELNQAYHIDFYADHNGNGQYDAPPVDHAWRVSFNSGKTGNDTLVFIHNTNFTDINWPGTISSVNSVDNSKPDSYLLNQNYPNPFNPTTNIKYSIIKESHVTLKVFDLLGREVESLVNQKQPSGSYVVNFNASKLASGVYIYRITAGDFVKSMKMILIK